MRISSCTWKIVPVAVLLMLGIAVTLLLKHTHAFQDGTPAEATEEGSVPAKKVKQASAEPRKEVSDHKGNASCVGQPETDDELESMEPESESEPEPKMTEEEKKEEEEEKLVDEFDAAVDKWMESAEKSVTMAEVDKFRDMFRRVPKDRKEECVQRALNLIPDDNVMLLAGILFDKEQDKEILDLVFNDILNRDEDIKKPILQQIFKDREHPNWADTAWILDVTGELPNARK